MQLQKSLLLDRNYVVLSIVPWRKAVKLLVKGKAEAVCGNNSLTNIRHASGNFAVPSVLRLLTIVPWKAHTGNIRFSRRNVISRDNSECQYCGRKMGKNATIDHVVPVSRGGKSEYTNCVASCHECNNKKADMTPNEAGFKLKKRPRNPTFATNNRALLDNPPEEWKIYIIGPGGADEDNI